MEIGAWGDSITYGSGDSEALGWVGRLRRALNPTNDVINVYNRGIPGDTSADVLKRFSVEAAAIEPNIVLIAVGANDSALREGRNRVSLSDFKKNLRELIALARKHTDAIYLLGVTRPRGDIRRPSGSEFKVEIIQEYGKIIEEVAKEETVGYIDLFETVASSDLTDGIHPNNQGYEKMFATIREALSSLLPL